MFCIINCLVWFDSVNTQIGRSGRQSSEAPLLQSLSLCAALQPQFVFILMNWQKRLQGLGRKDMLPCYWLNWPEMATTPVQQICLFHWCAVITFLLFLWLRDHTCCAHKTTTFGYVSTARNILWMPCETVMMEYTQVYIHTLNLPPRRVPITKKKLVHIW